MAERVLTREFSICLLLSEDVAADVEALRAVLPASPYRDDIPHITLLRGISSPADIDDEALLTDVERVTGLSGHLPLSGVVDEIANKSNQF